MTLHLPLGLLRTGAILLVAWGGAAAMVVAYPAFIEHDAVTSDDLDDYVRNSQLQRYATDSDLSDLRGDLEAAAGTSPTLEGVLSLLILNAAARGELRPDIVRTSLFADAAPTDFDNCMGWLSTGSIGEAVGREACAKVALEADFGN